MRTARRTSSERLWRLAISSSPIASTFYRACRRAPLELSGSDRWRPSRSVATIVRTEKPEGIKFGVCPPESCASDRCGPISSHVALENGDFQEAVECALHSGRKRLPAKVAKCRELL